jgi:hypothetical protein
MGVAAAGSYGQPHLIPTLNHECVVTAIATQLSGFANCSKGGGGSGAKDALAYVTRVGGAWRTVPVSATGLVRATASDAQASYVLLEEHQPNGSPFAVIGRRDSSGKFTQRSIGYSGSIGQASLVAEGGRWWAVWAASTGAGSESRLTEAGTLLGERQASFITAPGAIDVAPSLALRPHGGLVLVWQRLIDNGDQATGDIRLAVRTGDAWRSRTVESGDTQTQPQIATDGEHVFALWMRQGQPVVGSDESGTIQLHHFASRACARHPVLAVRPGWVVAFYEQCLQNGSGGNPDSGESVTALQRLAGRWTSQAAYKNSSVPRLLIAAAFIGTRPAYIFGNAPNTASYSSELVA